MIKRKEFVFWEGGKETKETRKLSMIDGEIQEETEVEIVELTFDRLTEKALNFASGLGHRLISINEYTTNKWKIGDDKALHIVVYYKD
jgi:hypothetical protein